jgi:hypothetical protein
MQAADTQRGRNRIVAVGIEQPTLDQRLGGADRLRQQGLRRRMVRQAQLPLKDFLHLGAQAVGQVRADKIIGAFLAHRAGRRRLQQVELGGEFPVQQRIATPDQEVEFA